MTTIALPSVKSLRIELAFGGQTLGTGTGFVALSATGPVLLTNRHKVTGKRQDDGKPISKTGGIPDRVRILHNRKSKFGEWVSREEILLADGKARWIEHPALGPKVDFVALPLQQVTLKPERKPHHTYRIRWPTLDGWPRIEEIVRVQLYVRRRFARNMGDGLRCVRARNRSLGSSEIPD